MDLFVLLTVCLCLFDFGLGKQNNNFIRRQQSKESSFQSSSIEYFTRNNQEIIIPIMIHLDPALTKKFIGVTKRRQIRHVFSDALKEVENIFRRPNLSHKIRLKLIFTRFLKNHTNMVVIDDNATNYLKNYCQWQERKKMVSQRWYYSILITGLDLYYFNDHRKEIRSSTGRGYMGGMCSMKKSCTLLEWRWKGFSHLLAHEIAHSLGVSHDGPPDNKCKSEGHIMSARYNPKRSHTSWSSCNKSDLEKFMRSKKSWCLRSDYKILSTGNSIHHFTNITNQ